jgi:hypothetical protein
MTTMPQLVYPGLYTSAGEAAASAQKSYLWLLRIEYALLTIAAVFSVVPVADPAFYIAYSMVFVAAFVVLLTRSIMKPEQTWYKSRALAESIKTLTWRYMMRSAPYADAERLQVPKGEFRNHLRQIIKANNFPEKTFSTRSADDQITVEMDSIRGLDLDARRSFYLENRINEQRKWYSTESRTNRFAFRCWLIFCILIYVLATASVLARIRFPDWTLWPTEPLTVIAASVVGWIQTKKFNELSTSYSLTAHEIGLVKSQISDVASEAQFSDFVNDAELAFSREHTQWVARQSD